MEGDLKHAWDTGLTMVDPPGVGTPEVLLGNLFKQREVVVGRSRGKLAECDMFPFIINFNLIKGNSISIYYHTSCRHGGRRRTSDIHSQRCQRALRASVNLNTITSHPRWVTGREAKRPNTLSILRKNDCTTLPKSISRISLHIIFIFPHPWIIHD